MSLRDKLGSYLRKALATQFKLTLERPGAALLCAIGSVLTLLGARVVLLALGLYPVATFNRADEPACEAAYFAALGSNKFQIDGALNFIADQLAARDDLFQLDPWSIDADSLTSKRLYLLSPDDVQTFADDARTARALADGDWNYLSLDAILGRFREKLRSELTSERVAAVERAIPFADALARAAFDGMTPDTEDRDPNPIAPGAERRVNNAPERIRYDASGLRGVVCAKILKRTPEAADFLLTTAQTALERFSNVSIDLDALCVEEYLQTRQTRSDAIRAASFGACALLAVGWLTLGSFSRAFAGLVAIFVALAWGLFPGGLVGPEWSLARVGSGVCVGAFVVYWAFAYLERYAECACRTRNAKEALKKIGATLDSKFRFSTFALAGASLAFLAFPSVESRRFGFGLAFGLLLAGHMLNLTLTAAVAFCEDDAEMNADPESQTFPAPLGLRSPADARVPFSYSAHKIATGIGLVAVCACAYFGSKLEYNWDANIEIQNLPGLELRGDRVAEISGRRALYAVAFAKDAAEADELEARFEEESSFITDALPDRVPDGFERCRALEYLDSELRALPLKLGEPELPRQGALAVAVARFAEDVENTECLCVEPDAKATLLKSLKTAQGRLESLSDRNYRALLDSFQSRTAVETLKRLFALKTLSNGRAPTVEDFSDRFRANYYADKPGRTAVYVYSPGELRDRRVLAAFAGNVRAVSDTASGPALTRADEDRAGKFAWKFGSLAALIVCLIAVAVRGSVADAAKLGATMGAIAAVTLGCAELCGAKWDACWGPALFAIAIAAIACASSSNGESVALIGVKRYAKLAVGSVFLACAFSCAFSDSSAVEALGRATALAAALWAISN